MQMQKCVALLVVLLAAAGSAWGVTVALTDGHSCVVMGSLGDNDGDGASVVLMGHGGAVARPYISTPFPGGGMYALERRAVAEFSLDPVRRVSTDPNAVLSARLTFYFDDVIRPDLAPEPWTTQDFTLELYVDSANGTLDGSDLDDLDPAVGGEGPDDWASPAIHSWRFVAGAAGPFVSGQEVVGIFGPNEPFPARFGDNELMVYGMIGFEVDVTDEVAALLAEDTVPYMGFRWISNTPDGYWTNLGPADYRPALSVDMTRDEPMTFVLQSSQTGPITGDQHSGRPYHRFNDPNDEAIYLTAREWSGTGHSPVSDAVWPVPDGIITWDVFTDPNRSSERPEAIALAADGTVRYVYWDTAGERYILIADENDVPEPLEKVYYREWASDRPLTIGNYGRKAGTTADMQHALLTEFKLERLGWYGLEPNDLVAAHIELTIDRVVDMSLSGNNMALLPSILYVNSYAGDGLIGRFENAQAAFERIDHEQADTAVWLTIDGAPDGMPITDFSLSWYKLVDPGLDEPLTLTIDVSESARQLLAEGASFAGFVLSGSPDGDFCLASVDLVDDVRDKAYLPALVLKTNLQ